MKHRTYSIAALAILLIVIMASAASCKKAPKVIKPDHRRGANCETCHGKEHKTWATSLHSASAADVLTNEEHNSAELLTDECITCHSPFQVGKLKISGLVQPIDQNGPWKIIKKGADQWQATKCEVCHDPTSKAKFKLAFYDGTQQKYVKVANATELCEKCHVAGTDDSRDLKGSVHEGLQCVACHLTKNMNINPMASCNSKNCHPKVDPNKMPTIDKLDTTWRNKNSKNNIHFITCTTCHEARVPTPKP
jgi:hypothetical protein